MVTGKLDVRAAAALLPEAEALPDEVKAELEVGESEELKDDGEDGEE